MHALDAFDSPSAVVALEDQRTLLVANTGRGEYGLVAGSGTISRARLDDTGHLTMDEQRFITGLNGPVGLTLLRNATEALPANTLAITVGGSWVVDEEGSRIPDDATRGTGLVFFDAETGEARGRILLGTGSPAAEALGHPVADPTGLTSDPEGNLYLIDVDVAATRSSRRSEANAGVIKIGAAAVTALLRDTPPPPDTIQFAREVSLPTAVVYSDRDDALFWGTFAGELRKLPGGDFSGRTAVITVSKEVGTVACLAVMPNGRVIGATANGTLLYVRGRGSRELRLRKQTRFLSPGEPVIVPGTEDRVWFVLPEQGGGIGRWGQRVNVISVPDDL